MHAVIFDIDGTLLQSNDVDGALYLTAVQSVLGEVRLRDSWMEYVHVTDSGILLDICADNEIVQTPQAVERIRVRFFEMLAGHIDSVGPFPEIPGARGFVSALRESGRYAVAYATGGWGPSARLKLSSAGFPLDMPLASADCHPDRISIMKRALSKLGRRFSSITYYGDALWDRAATDALGWQFVAVGKALAGLEAYPECNAWPASPADTP